MNLTEKRIAGLIVEPGRKDRLVFDDEQKGLAVRVTAHGRRYIVQYALHGARHRVPLGSCDAISLAKARKAAAAIMGDVAKGRHPAVERKEEARQAKAARDRLTLGELFETWGRLHLLANRRARYAAEAPRALNHAFAKYLGRPADELDRRTVVRILDELLKRSPAMANRTTAYGRAAFAWSMKRGAVQNNPFIGLPTVGKASRRARVLSDDEIKAVWNATARAISPYGSVVRILLLTGQRREEVAGMTWGELSADLSTWTIPRDRTKNGVEHVVPLAEAVSDIIRATLPDAASEREIVRRQTENALVFSGKAGTPYSGWSKSKTELDAASGVTDWVLHDLRRGLATGLQRLGVRLEVTEAVLNHVSGSRAGIVGIYQRHDWAVEKRAGLDAWAHHLGSILEPSTHSTNILRIAR